VLSTEICILFFSSIYIAFQTATAARPGASYMMTASVNPATNIAYYYGGQPLQPLNAAAVNILIGRS
jgi:hypothetical protein